MRNFQNTYFRICNLKKITLAPTDLLPFDRSFDFSNNALFYQAASKNM